MGRALLQRFPRNQPGVAGYGSLRVGSLLYHGTEASEFTHEHLAPAGPSPIHYEHPPAPDAPAWFAFSILFAMHAGVRNITPGAHGRMSLFRYRVRQQIPVLLFSDVHDLSLVLVEQDGGPPLHTNDRAAAERVLAMVTAGGAMEERLGGYVLAADRVRGEPEIILFSSGLRCLELDLQAGLRVTPVDDDGGPHHRVSTAGFGYHMGDYYHGMDADPGDFE